MSPLKLGHIIDLCDGRLRQRRQKWRRHLRKRVAWRRLTIVTRTPRFNLRKWSRCLRLRPGAAIYCYCLTPLAPLSGGTLWYGTTGLASDGLMSQAFRTQFV